MAKRGRPKKETVEAKKVTKVEVKKIDEIPEDVIVDDLEITGTPEEVAKVDEMIEEAIQADELEEPSSFCYSELPPLGDLDEEEMKEIAPNTYYLIEAGEHFKAICKSEEEYNSKVSKGDRVTILKPVTETIIIR